LLVHGPAPPSMVLYREDKAGDRFVTRAVTDGSSNKIRADSNTKFLLRIIHDRGDSATASRLEDLIGHATGRVPSDDLERKYQLWRCHQRATQVRAFDAPTPGKLNCRRLYVAATGSSVAISQAS
ncbi:hypothetical protein, partial [Amycolatopsis sacchari]